jgi:hypothetical protein
MSSTFFVRTTVSSTFAYQDTQILNIWDFALLDHINVFIIFIFTGWESTNMVLQREGKTFELEFCVQCSSWTEDCMWFSFSKRMLLFLSCWHYGWKTLIFLAFNILQTKLLRLHWPEKEPHSLSVIYKNGESSLDLVCTHQLATLFMIYLLT